MDIPIADTDLLQAVIDICKAVALQNGRGYLVGGCVRDTLLGQAVTDIDVEVHGIAPELLKTMLSARFAIDLVGVAFGVIKIRGLPIDVSLPRREAKSGYGHKGFDVSSDPFLSLEQAAARRDFTINAMAMDPLTGELFDHVGGAQDLQRRILRHTSPRFSEDPLRVLRGMQFTARFDLQPASETVALCRSIEPEGLARERVFDEWRKLILKGSRPSRGLQFLRDCGWVRYYPEIACLIDCPQDPEWHSEGDVWTHTLLCLDAFAGERVGDDHEDLVVGLAVLCHDLGKPATTRFEDGHIRSRGHTEAGEAPTVTFLSGMTNSKDLVDEVVMLVRNHLAPMDLYEHNAGDAAIRRLAARVKRIDRLIRVVKADQAASSPDKDNKRPHPALEWLERRARELEIRDAVPEPVIKGRHLIDMGLEPGPRFGRLLRVCYEAQMDGSFAGIEGGLTFLRALLAQDPLQDTGR